MQTQRQWMRSRVSKRFGRTPGQYGDMNSPTFYPVPIGTGIWGAPWAKVKNFHTISLSWLFIGFPLNMYYFMGYFASYRRRQCLPARCAVWVQRFDGMLDMDDPDYWIKYEALEYEQKHNLNWAGWGGANFMAGYLWEPGDPEPSVERKHAPAHHH